MGSIRTLLALAVALTHGYGFGAFSGILSVQLFYMISGYLISYILNDTKNYNDTFVFYKNRALRIYPVYFFVAILSLGLNASLLFYGTNSDFIQTYLDTNIMTNAVLILSNFIIFFQDWVMFLGVLDGNLQFMTNFKESDVLLYKGLLVPQAWTLGVELTFYLIAPFIVKKKFLTILLFSLSVAVRFFTIKAGIGLNDPWTYRFFPSELSLFLLGALSHQWLWPLIKSLEKNISSKLSFFVTVISMIMWLFYPYAPFSVFTLAAVIVIFSAFLPFLFIFQSEHSWDKYIGNLSYPLYICHMLVITILAQIGIGRGTMDPFLGNLLIGSLSLIFAWFIERLVAAPIEKRRENIKNKALQETS